MCVFLRRVGPASARACPLPRGTFYMRNLLWLQLKHIQLQ